MMRTLKTAFAAAAIVAASAIAASAATLDLIGPTQSQVIRKNDLVGLGLNGKTIQFITGAAKTDTNGLAVAGTGPVKITFTYLGKEARNINQSVFADGTTLFLGSDTVNSVKTTTQASAGLIDFAFKTLAPVRAIGEITNAGAALPNSPDYAIGYYKISDTSFYLLFDDIDKGDRDFDDHGVRIDIAAIPLPAGGLLLLTGLAGLAALRRRKAA